MLLRTTALLLFVALIAGCQSGQQTAMMENELRWVEDQYYLLENCLQEKCKELESCRLENQALRQQLSREGTTGGRTSSGSRVERVPTQTPRPSSRRPQNEDNESPPLIEPPTVEGVPDLGSRLPSVLNKPEVDGADLSQPVAPDPDADYPATSQPSPEAFELPGIDALDGSQSQNGPLYDANVTHVVLNRQLTGGYDFDGHVGDEGIMVVAEPRNSAGQFVPLAGGLDVTLRDPNAKPGDEEIAKWHLDARQAQAKVKKSLLGRGVHLELPWPGTPPEREDLVLQVSYTTVDGRTLNVERDVRIDPPRQLSARWTPSLAEPGETGGAGDVVRPQIIHEPYNAPTNRPREAPSIQKAASEEPGDPAWSPYR